MSIGVRDLKVLKRPILYMLLDPTGMKMKVYLIIGQVKKSLKQLKLMDLTELQFATLVGIEMALMLDILAGFLLIANEVP